MLLAVCLFIVVVVDTCLMFCLPFVLQLRMADDMQFAFSYLYFLMSERKVIDVAETFAALDADKSG